VRAPWLVLGLVTLAHALGAFAVLAVAPLSPFLLASLDLTRGQVGLLLPAVYLGGVLLSLPAGWLGDRLGVRATLAVGQVVTGVAIALSALADGLAPVLALLVVAGAGFSVINPTTGKAIIEWFPPHRRGFAMGVKQTGLTLGGVGAALVLPPLALASDWRWALVAAGAASLVSAVVVALVYRSPAGRVPPPPAGRPRLGDLHRFLERPGVLVVLACGLALSVAQSSVVAYLVLYATDTFALPPVEAARLLALAQIGGTASRLGWGAASDRFFGGRRRPGVTINALVGAVAYALFARGADLPAGALVPLVVVAGAAAFGWVGLYFALMAEIGGPRYAGLLTGVAVMAAWSGVLVGPPLFGLVLEARGRYDVSWLALAVIALAVALMLPRPRPLVDRG
jgi:MFS transporter, ACS family, hexuronate transporter